MVLSAFRKRIELSDGSHGLNEDVRPVIAEQRTWTFLTYNNFWLLINCNMATYLTGSALIPLGLTWWQAIIAMVLGTIIATVALILSSLAGAYYHIGFPIFSRAVWGIRGSQFVIWNRIFLSFVWYGFQSWVGGQCIYLILLSWDPEYEERIPNKIPIQTGMTSAQFLAYFIFCVISLPALWIRPYRIQKFFNFASAVTITFFLVLLIWALATMGPAGFGDTLQSGATIPTTGGPYSTVWLMIYGIMSTVGSIAAGILNQNDYARFSRHPGDAIWGQAFAFPMYNILTSVIGILVTAATQKRFGEPLWNPLSLLVRLLEVDNTTGTRAAIFFAGLALAISQLGSNVAGNALSGGLDLASVFPRWINLRRGAYLVALLSPIVNPWRLVNTATIFLTVLSGYGVFLAPMTGIMVGHYVIVARGKVNVDDLYNGSSGSIYWFTKGINWRAPVSWIVGVTPCLPGFVAAVNPSITVGDSAVELYYMNYLYGFLSSAVVYSTLHWVISDQRFDAFVKGKSSPKELQQLYSDRWDVTVGEGPESVSESIGGQHEKQPWTSKSSV